MSAPLFTDFRAMADLVAALPPRPYCFMAHHSVPYGQVLRQWDAAGRLLVWVNRGEVMDIPRLAASRADCFAIAPNAIDASMLAAIPVVFA